MACRRRVTISPGRSRGGSFRLSLRDHWGVTPEHPQGRFMSVWRRLYYPTREAMERNLERYQAMNLCPHCLGARNPDPLGRQGDCSCDPDGCPCPPTRGGS